jgi:phospholipase D1/2
VRRFVSILRLAAVPIVVVAALLIAWKLGYFELDRRQRFFDTVQRLRVLPWIPVWFAFLYAVLVALCLPAAILTLLCGAVFGAWVGSAIAWSGFMLGTALAYVIAHRLARRPMTRLFGEHKLLRKLKANDDVLTLFRLRVIPVAPLAVMSYVAGIADVSLKRLLIASAFGALPTIAYSYAGSALLRGMVSPDDASKRALWIAGAITVVSILLSLISGIRSRSGE